MSQQQLNIVQLPFNGQWPKSRSPHDCVICTFQHIGILTHEEGVHIRQTKFLTSTLYLKILDEKLGKHNWKEVDISDLDLNELTKSIYPGHAIVVSLKSIIPGVRDHSFCNDCKR